MTTRIINDPIHADVPEAIIFFTPREMPANPGRIMSYMHIGQHSEATMSFMKYDTHYPKTREERDLCRTLNAEWNAI